MGDLIPTIDLVLAVLILVVAAVTLTIVGCLVCERRAQMFISWGMIGLGLVCGVLSFAATVLVAGLGAVVLLASAQPVIVQPEPSLKSGASHTVGS